MYKLISRYIHTYIYITRKNIHIKHINTYTNYRFFYLLLEHDVFLASFVCMHVGLGEGARVVEEGVQKSIKNMKNMLKTWQNIAKHSKTYSF